MKDEGDLWALWSRIRAEIAEAAQMRRAQLTHPDFFIGGRQNGKPRGQQAPHVIMDETWRLTNPPVTVEGVALKYATAQNTGPARDWRWELRVRELQLFGHQGVDYLGNPRAHQESGALHPDWTAKPGGALHAEGAEAVPSRALGERNPSPAVHAGSGGRERRHPGRRRSR